MNWHDKWRELLGITKQGKIERIPADSVTSFDRTEVCNFVGVVDERNSYRIVHVRDLVEADIVHELLHVLLPRIQHPAIEKLTSLLIARYADEQ